MGNALLKKFTWIVISSETGLLYLRYFYREKQNGPQSIFVRATSRQTGMDLKTYKQLQVLNALYNNSLQDLAWPSFILCNLSCHCLCIYIAVKLYDQVPLYVSVLFSSWAVLWVVIDFVIFPHMGQTMELSVEYLYQLSGQVKRSNLDRAMLKALRPMGIKVGYLFTMDRTTVLMIIVIVSNLTINALLLM